MIEDIQALRQAARLTPDNENQEIGRASCRERV